MTDKEYFDLYGCKQNDIDLVRKNLEDALGIQMEERDSFYFGRYFSFYRGKESDTHEVIECQENWNYEDRAIYEKEYPDYPILVCIDCTTRSDELEKKLKTSSIQFDLLRRDAWDPETDTE